MIESAYFDVESLRVHCLTAGAGGTFVLLLHGGGQDSARFSLKHAIEPLARDHQVFAPDWPGYGESEQPDAEHDIEFYAGFLGNLMDTLGLDRASLVGISMGGGAALGFALHSPERVDKLVLVDSYGLGSEAPMTWLGYVLVRTPLVNRLIWSLLPRSRQVTRWNLYAAFHDRRAVTEQMVEEAFQTHSRPGAGRAFRSFVRNEVRWSGLRTDFSERLHEIKVPTLILHGENDRAVPVAWARRAHECIANSKLHTIENCGHVPSRERPKEFNRVLKQFLTPPR